VNSHPHASWLPERARRPSACLGGRLLLAGSFFGVSLGALLGGRRATAARTGHASPPRAMQPSAVRACVIPVALCAACLHACLPTTVPHNGSLHRTVVVSTYGQHSSTTRHRTLSPRRRADACRRGAPQCSKHRGGESTHGFITDGRQGVRGSEWRHARSLARCDSADLNTAIIVIPKGHQSNTASTSCLPITNHCKSLLPGLGPTGQGGLLALASSVLASASPAWVGVCARRI